MAADVSGYSRLMSEDERSTIAMLDLSRAVFREHIEGLGGRVIDMTGDSVLALFDETLSAARAAIAIQQGLHVLAVASMGTRRMRYRVGLHIGQVMEKADGTIYGDVVNVSARMQTYAPPGGIAMSQGVADLMRSLTEAALADLGELYLHNVARPVRMFCVSLTDSADPLPGQLPPGEEGRPSIAVLPFRRNMPLADDTYFADGIVDDIIYLLAGFKALFVIARGSTLGLGGDQVDLRGVARQLGVRYLLYGSVQRAGERLRVVAELAEPETGTVIRSYRHDGRIDSLFDLQDHIALDVVRAIAPQVQARELQRAQRKHPQNMSAYDLVLQGIDQMFRLNQQASARARGLLQQAMVLDPMYATAYSYAAYWYVFRVGEGWSEDPIADAREAERLAATAIKLNPDDPQALAVHGHVQSFLLHDFEGARGILDRAIEVGPNSALAYTMSCATCSYLGMGEMAVEHGRQGLRLSPVDAHRFWHEGVLAQAHYILGDHAEAVAFARKAAGRHAGVAFNLRILCASLVALERMDEARGAGQQLLRVLPSFRLGPYARRCPFRGAVLTTWLERLRLAGIPE